MALTKIEFIQRYIDMDQLRTKPRPAFFDGDSIITLTGKYHVLPYGAEDWQAVKYQVLTVRGFERNLSNWMTDYEWDTQFVTYWNPAADDFRRQWKTRELAVQAANEEAARIRREAEAAEQAKHTAHIHAIHDEVRVAKFRRKSFQCHWQAGDTRTVIGIVYKGIGVQRDGSSGFFTLTHIYSGLGFSLNFESQSLAKTAAVRLGNVLDCTNVEASEVISNVAIRQLRDAMKLTGKQLSNAYAEVKADD